MIDNVQHVQHWHMPGPRQAFFPFLSSHSFPSFCHQRQVNATTDVLELLNASHMESKAQMAALATAMAVVSETTMNISASIATELVMELQIALVQQASYKFQKFIQSCLTANQWLTDLYNLEVFAVMCCAYTFINKE